METSTPSPQESAFKREQRQIYLAMPSEADYAIRINLKKQSDENKV